MYRYFSRNGIILPQTQAQIPLRNIEYSYGYGVYELIKVRGGIAYFVKQHIDRLLNSAKIIEISHKYSKDIIVKYVYELLKTEKANACNIKIMLIGGKTDADSKLFVLPLSPFFLHRKFYVEGVNTITHQYERLFPNAKTLNMLGSFLAYKKARDLNCYDALLTDKDEKIIEGTRTNFFLFKKNILLTQHDEKILKGVTREILITIALREGLKIQKKEININQLHEYDGAFLTSTSANILPVKQIDNFIFPNIPKNIKILMQKYDKFLKESHGVLSI